MTGFSPPEGFRYLSGHLDRSAQENLVAAISDVVVQAPLFLPVMPRTGRPFSVRMSNCGSLGWVSDIAGYRYQRLHPETGQPWPPIPPSLIELWEQLTPAAPAPEACLINFYESGAKMGLHQDRDEQDFAAPVVSISLGDTAVFRIGGTARKGPTRSLRLASGDVVVLGGPARLAYHGIDRILFGSSTLIAGGGRINLTLRRVNPAT